MLPTGAGGDHPGRGPAGSGAERGELVDRHHSTGPNMAMVLFHSRWRRLQAATVAA